VLPVPPVGLRLLDPALPAAAYQFVLAGTALTPARLLPDVGVLRRELVPVDAVGLEGVDSRGAGAAQDVLPARLRPNVVGVDAPAVVALVIKGKSRLPVRPDVEDAVSAT